MGQRCTGMGGKVIERYSAHGMVVAPGEVFDVWPSQFDTKDNWWFRYGRKLKRGATPCFFCIDDGRIPIYHVDQTQLPRKPLSDFEVAKTEFLRRFWFYSRRDRYLLCDDGTSTIDWNWQNERGVRGRYFGQEMMLEHLMGKCVYGIFPKSYPHPPAKTYWIAVDLDLHLDTGGNLELFMRQVQAVLSYTWGNNFCQVVVSQKNLNGIHIYLYFDRPLVLAQAREKMQEILDRIHTDHPEIEKDVEQWNERVKTLNPAWKVKQIKELEIYPDEKHGFRCIGTRGKVVLADKVIGTTSWGAYKRGKRKGQPKYGFDIVSWWKSLQSKERMPLKDVVDYIKDRYRFIHPMRRKIIGVENGSV